MSIEKMNINMFGGAAAYLDQSRRSLDSRFVDVVKGSLANFEVATFLDVGCGIGYLTNLIHDLFPSAQGLGIDVSQDLIDVARKHEVDGIEYRQGDVYQIEAGDDAFDLTACQTLFIHLKQPEKAISEMLRVTKPSGRILILEPVIYDFGMVGFSPGESATRKRLRDQLHQFDVSKKSAGGIDMQIAVKMPSLLMSAGAVGVHVESVNLLKLVEETAEPLQEATGYSSYDEFMIELGYNRSAIDELKTAERSCPGIRGEFTMITLLVITASPNKLVE